MKSVAVSLLFACVSMGFAQAAPAGEAGMVRTEIAVLEFIGGGTPLTAEERQEAAEIVAKGMQAHPDLWTAADRNAQLLLAEIAKKNTVDNRALREANRYVYAFTTPNMGRLGEEFVLEQRIVESHDPVVAIDTVHRRLVTQHSLGILRQTSAWVAQSYGIAGPAANFDTQITADLKQQLSSLEPGIGDGIAHIERDAIYAPPYYAGITAAQKQDIFVTRRSATFPNLNDAKGEQWQIAEAAGMLSRFAATQTQNAMIHSTTSALLHSQQRQLNSLHNAAVGASPACNVTTGSYEDRAASGCYH